MTEIIGKTYIRNLIKQIAAKDGYEFFIVHNLPSNIELYFVVYNRKGKFIDNKLWGIYRTFEEIAIILNNILKRG